jgi:chromosome segregation ATPase
MSPLSSKRDIVVLTECATKIEHLEETVKELKQELSELRKEKKENKNRISDRRFAIYLLIASILGGTISQIISWVLSSI